MTRVLVVGGQSRAAQAFRRRAACNSELALAVLVRRPCDPLGGEEIITTADYFDPPEDVLRRTDVVVNFAGITHGTDVALLDSVNAEGPVRLARAAMRCGVGRLIHLSSFHVYGYGERISLESPECPVTPYGRSKQKADRNLLALDGGGFSAAVLRLPMLYGDGEGDNLRRLARLMLRFPFFPVPSTPARRSVQHVENLAVVIEDVIRTRSDGILLAADAEPLTTELLAEVLREVSGRAVTLVRLPDWVFRPLGILSRPLYSRLYRSNMVNPADCVRPVAELPVAIRRGLIEFLSGQAT